MTPPATRAELCEFITATIMTCMREHGCISSENILQALESSGVALTVREPTEEMTRAGVYALFDCREQWRAMLAASPFGKSLTTEGG